jgi:cytochrome c-type biogenesis protein CcmH/NrfF
LKEKKMNRQKMFIFAVLAALVLGSLIAACGSGQQDQDAPAQLDGEALTQERCSTCHDISRVESAQKTEDEWRANVERMVAKGADLDAEEQEAVIQYLAETYGK